MKKGHKEYRVRWDIDLYSTGPRRAAIEALKIQRDSKSTATLFEVAPVVMETGKLSSSRLIDLSFPRNGQVENDPSDVSKALGWTVILLCPDYMTRDFGADIYVDFSNAEKAFTAVKNVQRMAVMAQGAERAEMDPADFRCIAVFRGCHSCVLNATSFEMLYDIEGRKAVDNAT